MRATYGGLLPTFSWTSETWAVVVALGGGALILLVLTNGKKRESDANGEVSGVRALGAFVIGVVTVIVCHTNLVPEANRVVVKVQTGAAVQSVVLALWRIPRTVVWEPRLEISTGVSAH